MPQDDESSVPKGWTMPKYDGRPEGRSEWVNEMILAAREDQYGFTRDTLKNADAKKSDRRQAALARFARATLTRHAQQMYQVDVHSATCGSDMYDQVRKGLGGADTADTGDGEQRIALKRWNAVTRGSSSLAPYVRALYIAANGCKTAQVPGWCKGDDEAVRAVVQFQLKQKIWDKLEQSYKDYF